jgi:hypothetical protein
MNLRFLSSICFLFLLGACHKGEVMKQLPSNLLNKAQMISLLVDIHLTEASLKLNQTGTPPKDINLYYSSTYTPVFKKHKTTPEQFEQSLQWYSRHIDQLDEIYTEVITRLSKLQAQIKSKPVKKSGKKIVQHAVPVKNISQQDSVAKKAKPTTPEKNAIKFVMPTKK